MFFKRQWRQSSQPFPFCPVSDPSCSAAPECAKLKLAGPLGSDRIRKRWVWKERNGKDGSLGKFPLNILWYPVTLLWTLHCWSATIGQNMGMPAAGSFFDLALGFWFMSSLVVGVYFYFSKSCLKAKFRCSRHLLLGIAAPTMLASAWVAALVARLQSQVLLWHPCQRIPRGRENWRRATCNDT